MRLSTSGSRANFPQVPSSKENKAPAGNAIINKHSTTKNGVAACLKFLDKHDHRGCKRLECKDAELKIERPCARDFPNGLVGFIDEPSNAFQTHVSVPTLEEPSEHTSQGKQMRVLLRHIERAAAAEDDSILEAHHEHCSSTYKTFNACVLCLRGKAVRRGKEHSFLVACHANTLAARPAAPAAPADPCHDVHLPLTRDETLSYNCLINNIRRCRGSVWICLSCSNSSNAAFLLTCGKNLNPSVLHPLPTCHLLLPTDQLFCPNNMVLLRKPLPITSPRHQILSSVKSRLLLDSSWILVRSIHNVSGSKTCRAP